MLVMLRFSSTAGSILLMRESLRSLLRTELESRLCMTELESRLSRPVLVSLLLKELKVGCGVLGGKKRVLARVCG